MSLFLCKNNKVLKLAVITLTSDMGNRDYYVAAVKGAIYSLLPQAIIVDISHHVSPFEIAQASFILKNAYPAFPGGSIHIIGVNPEKITRLSPFDMREEVKHIVVLHKGHYFIGADNGIFSLLFDDTPEKIFEITVPNSSQEDIFPVKNVFVPVACHLAKGGKPEEIGLPLERVNQKSVYAPVVEANVIKGMVIYVDVYGNVITNISKQLFYDTAKGRSFVIYFRKGDYEINQISNAYSDVPGSEMLAIFSSSGLLEIAINQGVESSGGGATQLLGLKLNDSVRVEFY